MSDLLYLGYGDLADLAISTEALLERIEQLLLATRDGTATSTPKSSIHPGSGRLFMSTLAHSMDPPFMAVKSLGMNNANPSSGLEPIGSLINLFDGVTGLPLAIMDGRWITGIRTAALSAVAARRLASADSRVLAFAGCGMQARSHLQVFADLFDITEVRALGRGEQSRDALLDLARGRSMNAIACVTAAELVYDADIVISSVPESPDLSPVLDAADLKAGAFVSMVDLARSWKPESLTAFGSIYIDDRVQEATMGSPMVPMNLVAGDLSDLADSNAPVMSGTTAFAFRGVATGDLALASLCYEAARRSGAGQTLAL